MPGFRCPACKEGTSVCVGHACPRCGSIDVQFAVSIEELADDDPLIIALTGVVDDEPKAEE
jgi:hypothetical protein